MKTVSFSDRQYIGDPLNAAYIFSGYEVDELIVLDIDASCAGRLIPLPFVQALARFARVPLTVGGGICMLEQVQSLVAAGVERVILGSALNQGLGFLEAASSRFGASTISVVINVLRASDGSPLGYFGRGNERQATPLMPLALLCERAGAGELLVHDVEREGTRIGFDVGMYATLNELLSIPVVALGGCGSEGHIEELLRATALSGVAAGSLFAYATGTREVLLNYPHVNSVLRAKLRVSQGPP